MPSLGRDGAGADRSAAGTRDRRLLALWIACALISIGSAIWIAIQPDRMLDFRELRGWLAFWDFGVHDPYAVPWLNVDYPPNALVVLSPLDWLHPATARFWYLPLNLAIVTTGAWLLARWLSGVAEIRLSRVSIATMAAMFLSTSAVRTSLWLGQTMPLAFVLGVVALMTARRRPVIGAIALGLAAFKPHVAVGFGLAIALTDGLAVPLGAALLALLTLVLYAAMGRQDLVAVLIEYTAGLARQYGAPDHVQSATSIRELIDLLVGHHARTAVAIQTVLAAVSLGWLVIGARRARRDGMTLAWISAASLAWTLLVLPHQKFGVMLLMPAWYLLLWPAAGLVRSAAARRASIVVVAACVFLDLPAVIQIVAHRIESYSIGSLWYPAMVWIERAADYPLHLLVAASFVMLMITHRLR